MVYRLPGAQF